MGIRLQIQKIGCLLWLVGICFLIPRHVLAEGLTGLEEAKKGIVEIQAGFKDEKGIFRKVKSGSGFLIGGREGKMYIITGNRVARITKKEKRLFCEKHEIQLDTVPAEDVVRIIVKGDVAMETSILASSKAKDFAILNIENIINEKQPLRLREDFEWKAGEKVSVLSFRQEIKGQQFMDSDVEEYIGEIQIKDVNLDKEYSFRYAAELPDDCIGGVLLDEEGYVIGIPNSVLSKPQEGQYAATAVNEIVEVLDNFSIYYDSYLKDKKKEELENLYKESVKMYESGIYKQDSLEKLETALAHVKDMKETGFLTMEEMEEGCASLQSAKNHLALKTDKSKIVVIVLGIILIVLFIWLLQLLIRNRIDEKKRNLQVQNPTTPRRQMHGDGQEVLQSRREISSGQAQKREDYQDTQIEQKDTEVLTEIETSQISAICLARKKTGEEFFTDKERTVIGKGAAAGIRIEGNTAVSREHAVILRKKESYFIRDKGSLNGTFVNGKRLGESEEAIICTGDVVRLANEELAVK